MTVWWSEWCGVVRFEDSAKVWVVIVVVGVVVAA